MRYVRCDVISLLKLTMASRRMFSASFSALGKEHQPHLLQVHHSQPLPASILAYRMLLGGGAKGTQRNTVWSGVCLCSSKGGVFLGGFGLGVHWVNGSALSGTCSTDVT